MADVADNVRCWGRIGPRGCPFRLPSLTHYRHREAFQYPYLTGTMPPRVWGGMRRRASIGIALLALSHLAFANVSSALAQAGSTGDTIGKQDKSISGGGAEADKPRAKSHATYRASTGPRSEARSGSADGTWAVSATPSCLPAWTLTTSVSNGVISGGGATGQVSRAGAVRGNAVVLGFKFDFVGHFRGRQASGTLVGPNGCPGQWTATKS
jgi:hypothetical protein